MGGSRRRVILGIGTAAVILTIAAASAVVAGDRRDRWFYDEAWMIQVLNRMLSGDVLYRDVFLGVTPLSLYLLQAAGFFFGAEAWLLRALNALCMLAMAALSSRIARKLELPWALAAAIVLCVAGWMRPTPAANYSYVAQVFLMAAGCALIESRPTLAAAFAGLAFASKQNTGLLALALVLLFARREWMRPLAAFTMVAALVLAPVVWSGGGAALLEYGFLGKATYLKQGAALPPVQGIERILQLAHDRGFTTAALAAMRFAPFLFALAPAALALLAWRNRPAFLVAALGLASVAAAAPRFDLDHLRVAVPACVCALALLAWRWKLPHPAAWLAAPALLFAVYEYGAPLAAIPAGESKLVALPHYRFVFAQAGQVDEIARRSDALKHAAQGGGLYLQSSRAGILYLLTGLRNPTPFDYPLASAFGRAGQQRLIRDFERPNSACAWVETNEHAELAPVELIRYLHSSRRLRTAAAGAAIYCR